MDAEQRANDMLQQFFCLRYQMQDLLNTLDAGQSDDQLTLALVEAWAMSWEAFRPLNELLRPASPRKRRTEAV